MVAFSPAAEAGNEGHGRGHSKWDRHDKHHYRYVSVPRRMHGHYRDEFRYAYAGRTYYRPHHHDHVIYRYPVVVGGVVQYRPYYYCNDELFVTAYAPLPRVVVGFNIRPGLRIEGSAY